MDEIIQTIYNYKKNNDCKNKILYIHIYNELYEYNTIKLFWFIFNNNSPVILSLYNKISCNFIKPSLISFINKDFLVITLYTSCIHGTINKNELLTLLNNKINYVIIEINNFIDDNYLLIDKLKIYIDLIKIISKYVNFIYIEYFYKVFFINEEKYNHYKTHNDYFITNIEKYVIKHNFNKNLKFNFFALEYDFDIININKHFFVKNIHNNIKAYNYTFINVIKYIFIKSIMGIYFN